MAKQDKQGKRGGFVNEVAAATGIDKASVRAVVDTAFSLVREKALAGEAVKHPKLGRIAAKVKGDKTVYRFVPAGKKVGAGRSPATPTEDPSAGA